ncbi:ABC transporter ATP-binding protein [Algicella marina]|uniref:ATP-binding cassette domain-containing protein n=1 Tax=Algicella marina TaxID=2683284 RepID=A0A6P1SYM2_9RHOB|nr:ABC transporter ATP-binding protein [Algicella marina]QHQ35784.1 ATP-binding cassette domain-containing protein [Algicella marina]
MLDLVNITKRYGTVKVLDGVSLSVAAGETVALVGESGSGKSTLLHLIAALDAPDAGLIQVNHIEITGMGERARAEYRRQDVALIFQQFNLIPSLDIAANIAFQARLAGRYDADWCAALAERLGLTEMLSRYPEQVSGGQAQRIAVARALAARPKLLLADEPTGNLDEATGDAVLAAMQELVEETGSTLLMVTHSTRLAPRLSRIVSLRAGRLSE